MLLFMPPLLMEVNVADQAEGAGWVGEVITRSSAGDPAEKKRVAQYLRALADEAEDAIPRIEQTIENLRESLAAKLAELERFRADADEAWKDAE